MATSQVNVVWEQSEYVSQKFCMNVHNKIENLTIWKEMAMDGPGLKSDTFSKVLNVHKSLETP